MATIEKSDRRRRPRPHGLQPVDAVRGVPALHGRRRGGPPARRHAPALGAPRSAARTRSGTPRSPSRCRTSASPGAARRRAQRRRRHLPPARRRADASHAAARVRARGRRRERRRRARRRDAPRRRATSSASRSSSRRAAARPAPGAARSARIARPPEVVRDARKGSRARDSGPGPVVRPGTFRGLGDGICQGGSAGLCVVSGGGRRREYPLKFLLYDRLCPRRVEWHPGCT